MDEVRIRRSGERVLSLAGRTSSYRVEPRGEYVFGVVLDGVMRARRGGAVHDVGPGQVVAWDPTQPHRGSSREGWSARLIVVEAGGVSAETLPLDGVRFPAPVLDDPELARRLITLDAGCRLERESRLTAWLLDAVDRHGRAPRGVTPADARSVRLAMDHLAADPVRNVSLRELATVARTTEVRLIRAFGEQTGLPPHALQLAHRIRLARRLLERGTPIAETAAATGFTDQSHLHRHFRRTLGITPGLYQRRLTAQDATR